jgi:multiple sugar transport system permease protein
MTAISQRPVGRTQAQTRRPRWPQVPASVWIHAALILGLILVVGPFLWMLLGSFKTTAEIRQVPPTWFPVNPTMQNYTDLVSKEAFPRYFFNSTVVASAITLGNLLFCSMLGYALAKLTFPGKRVLFVLVLGMLMVPGIVTLTPLFVLITNLHISNTHAALILPFLAGPFGVFLMRQFISDLPDELIDAARVDGASEYYIFSRIILPLSGPALATLAILTFLGSWNNFLWPLVVAQTQDMYTLPVAIALFATGQNQTNFGLLMAGSVIVIVPVLLVFLALQRYFTQGIAMTGFK